MNPTQRRILIVDDDPLIRHIVVTALAKDGYAINEADSGAEGLAQASASQPDLILLDVMMPDVDGYEICFKLRSNPLTVNIPIVMLTALGEIGERVRGMQMGADDYITKPFDPRELRSRVDAHLRRSARDLSASPLTKLPGNPIIEQVLSARLASREPLAVMYIDLTHFKSYNDEYGWLRGDEVIRMLGQEILDVVTEIGGKDDFIGHVGGDDFIVITTPERAKPLAEELIRRFDARIPQSYNEVDRARGYVEVTDRQGQPFRAPIATLAIAIVANDRRPLEHPLQVASCAAEVKKFVKSLPGSQFAFDRRGK
jgi:diguanylate cyclase (GGDEF)-like protein